MKNNIKTKLSRGVSSKAACLRYYLTGLNATEIGKLTGYSPRTIQDFARLEGWRKLRRGTPPATVRQVWQMICNGYKPKEIAAHFSRSLRWVHTQTATARKMKLPLRKATANDFTDNRQKLFNYMAKEHGVILLASDMQEIERILKEGQNKPAKAQTGKTRANSKAKRKSR